MAKCFQQRKDIACVIIHLSFLIGETRLQLEKIPGRNQNRTHQVPQSVLLVLGSTINISEKYTHRGIKLCNMQQWIAA